MWSWTHFHKHPNKKIDRTAFPAPEGATVLSTAAYVPPAQGIQSELVEMWQNLLGIDRVGINENFFDLGGHSLLAVQLHRRIEASLGVELSITDVFRFPTIASLTGHLEVAGTGARRPTTIGRPSGVQPAARHWPAVEVDASGADQPGHPPAVPAPIGAISLPDLATD